MAAPQLILVTGGGAGAGPPAPEEPQEPEKFEDDLRKYRCCCGCWHVKEGVRFFCICSMVVLLLLAIFAAIVVIDFYTEWGLFDKEIFPLWIRCTFAGWVGVQALSVLLAFAGLKVEVAGNLVPAMAITLINMVLLVIVAVAMFWVVPEIVDRVKEISNDRNFSFSNFDVDHANRIGIIVSTCLVILFLAVALWVFILFWQCYLYFKDKAEWTDAQEEKKEEEKREEERKKKLSNASAAPPGGITIFSATPRGSKAADGYHYQPLTFVNGVAQDPSRPNSLTPVTPMPPTTPNK